MPGIDFLKDWDVKKHGWPALLVAAIFTAYEVFAPKDPSCSKNVIYLQTLVDRKDRVIASKDSANFVLEQELLAAKNIIHGYHEATKPYIEILKKK